MSHRGPDITGRLAHAAAAHPGRTIGGWLIAVVVSLVLVGTALHGLSSTPHAVGSPDSVRATQLLDQAFPAQARGSGEVIVLASPRSHAGAPAFDGAVRRIETGLRALPGVSGVQTHLDGVPGLVSRDGHATLIRLSVSTDAQIKPVVALVQATNGHAGLAAAITGQHTVGNDFTTLSQHDLSNGELAFGLPAALIVLVLVFGALVSGLVPDADGGRCRSSSGWGSSRCSRSSSRLSVFVVNMLTGMGLALGIDYSLFVVSRYREERGRGLAQAGRDRALWRDAPAARSSSAAARSSSRCSGCCSSDLDHAQPGRRRDRRRDRLGRRRADAAAGAPQPRSAIASTAGRVPRLGRTSAARRTRGGAAASGGESRLWARSSPVSSASGASASPSARR